MPVLHRLPQRPGPLLPQRLARALEMSILASLLLAVLVSRMGSISFHRDESTYIAMTPLFEEFVGARFSSPAWDESRFTKTQPPVALYVVALGRRVGGYRPGDLNQPWNWAQDWDSNTERGAMPSADLLWWSRLPVALVSAVAMLITFLLITNIVGRSAAYVWILLAATNSFLLDTLGRAMGEGALIAGVVLVTYACYQLLQVTSSRDHDKWLLKAFVWASLGAIAAGLAAGVKLNGAAALGGLLLVIGVAAIDFERAFGSGIGFLVCASLLAVSLAFLTFVLVYPYLWPNPIGRSIGMLEFRMHEMRVQQQVFPGTRIGSVRQRVQIVPRRVLEQSVPFGIGGFLLPTVVLLLGTGVGFIVHRSLHGLAHGADSSAVAMLAVASMVAFPSLLTPLDWARYYFLPVYFARIFIAVGVGWYLRQILRLSQRRIRRWRTRGGRHCSTSQAMSSGGEDASR